ncbi:MAG: DNA-directed RNA polymerase, subunit E'' [ANME-2 cluster archaeon]|jgi:DNA-directed RNA polymerase subunit E"|nr:DNA-directed RNA polymerase, subunit E'' [ANME-2 cluster archaeon]
MSDKACNECHRITSGTTCAVCGSSTLSSDWSGYVVIIDPSRSNIAKKLKVDLRGEYALKVR